MSVIFFLQVLRYAEHSICDNLRKCYEKATTVNYCHLQTLQHLL